VSTVVLAFSSGMNIFLAKEFESEISKKGTNVQLINVEDLEFPLFHF
jgi:hypothetical protein